MFKVYLLSGFLILLFDIRYISKNSDKNLVIPNFDRKKTIVFISFVVGSLGKEKVFQLFQTKETNSQHEK